MSLAESGKKLVQGGPKQDQNLRGEVVGGVYVDLAVAKKEFIEVTGLINQDKNASIVEYTWEHVPYDSSWEKPIADLAGTSTSEVRHNKAVLVLYDDGWRVR